VKNQKILVIGSSSMVGSRVIELLSPYFSFLDADRKNIFPKNVLEDFYEIDIRKKEDVFQIVKKKDFDWLWHFAAYTDVDEAESQRDDEGGLCWQVNALGTQNIVHACKKFDKKILYVSTDFVFDGKSGPYSEEDKPAGNSKEVSWYGWSKLAGEKIVLAANIPYLLVRISYPFRAYFPQKGDFLRNILERYKNGDLYPFFDDQKFTPTFIDDLAHALKFLIEKKALGIYHVACSNPTTPLEFGQRLLGLFFQAEDKVEKTSIKKFLAQGDKTPKPINGGLKVDKLLRLGFNLRTWQEAQDEVFRQQKAQGLTN
jgi:dTDP-4-dehydrorhamnose reductase